MELMDTNPAKAIQEEASEENKEKKNPTLKEQLVDMVETCVIAVIVFMIVTFGFDKSIIMSGSMEPTLMTGDSVVFIALHHVDRGDIIEFERDGEILSKRVIGIAGDTISFENGCVIRNGEEISEPYLKSQYSTFPALKESYMVPEGKIFVMGDNRLNSFDSRYWDDPYVDTDAVLGKYFFSLYKAKK